jgi:C4-dicarboxylate-binding protein DctP
LQGTPVTLLRPALIAIALNLFGWAAHAEQNPPIVIKFSHVVAPDAPKGKAALLFKERAEKYCNGRVRVDVYPNSELYNDKDEIEALQLGAIQMVAPSFAKFSPLGVKEFEVIDLPFLFQDKATLRKITNGPIGRWLLAKLDSKGFTGLAFWDNGFKIISANRPIKTPSDMRGLKMRIQPSKVIQIQMQVWGAVPTVFAFKDVYHALQTGAVDGTENPPSNMYTQRMYEVQKYATLTHHGYLGYVVVVNKAFWEDLPDNIRANLEKAMAEATTYENEIAQQENDDALTAMKKSGKTEFYTPTPEEMKAWVETAKTIHAAATERVGRDLLEKIYKETGIRP